MYILHLTRGSVNNHTRSTRIRGFLIIIILIWILSFMLQNVFCNFPRYIETIATAFREGGHTKAASLVSPDAHVVLSGPKIINLVNGITISLVDLGLIERFRGFAERNLWNCDRLAPGGSYYGNSDGKYLIGDLVIFTPSNPHDAAHIVNEQSLLLTVVRLNQDSRSVFATAYSSAADS